MKNLVLLVEKFLETFLLLVKKCSTAQVVQKVEDSSVSMPEVLFSQNLKPELKNSYCTNTPGPGALQNMSLQDNKIFS